jgi:hypothetical protein
VVIAALVVLSLVLTAAVLFPDISPAVIIGILIGGSLLFAAAGVAFVVFGYFHRAGAGKVKIDRSRRASWRMPPLTLLAAPKLSAGSRIGLTVLRSYLLIAMILVIFRVYQLAIGH